MTAKTALVLSGGGMFGAWQAGAWREVSKTFRPDLVVGASVGSLNGYAIACGATPEQLCGLWKRPEMGGFRNLRTNIQAMMHGHAPRLEYAVVLVDLLRMKPETFTGAAVTWRHLYASCAVPLVVPPQRIGGRWYVDGGLLNPLPVWAAVELGAREIVALHALPEIPSAVLKPFVKLFRAVFGHHPPVPADVRLTTILPGAPLGTMRDALHWKRENIERWFEQGARDAKTISIPNCLER